MQFKILQEISDFKTFMNMREENITVCRTICYHLPHISTYIHTKVYIVIIGKKMSLKQFHFTY